MRDVALALLQPDKAQTVVLAPKTGGQTEARARRPDLRYGSGA